MYLKIMAYILSYGPSVEHLERICFQFGKIRITHLKVKYYSYEINNFAGACRSISLRFLMFEKVNPYNLLYVSNIHILLSNA